MVFIKPNRFFNDIKFIYFFRYLPAILNAKEGNIINTVVNKSLINASLMGESFLFGPEDVRTTQIPIIPKAIDAYIKICVAIFCMYLLYQKI